MARVTVEDCIQFVANRFELVVVAAQRSKDISAGAPLTISRDNDKDAVVSLREIADQTVSVEQLREEIIDGMGKPHLHERFAVREKIASANDDVSEEIDEDMKEMQAMAKVSERAQAKLGNLSFADDNLDIED